jgi:ABC-type multidrug transport system permease subunit
MGRVVKRTAIFAPLILVVVFWTGGDSTTASKVFTAVTLIAFFIPFSYLVDSIMYRVYSKRQRGTGSG